MNKVKIYGNEACAYCGAARMLLTKKGIKFEDILVSENAEQRAEMEARSQRRSVPQIFIGEKHIGGFNELCELEKSGELDKLLASL